MAADWKWTNDNKLLSLPLISFLDSLKNAQKFSKHYYVKFLRADNPEFKNENAYNDIIYPDAGFNLLSLFRFWNMVHYFFSIQIFNWRGLEFGFIGIYTRICTGKKCVGIPNSFIKINCSDKRYARQYIPNGHRLRHSKRNIYCPF